MSLKYHDLLHLMIIHVCRYCLAYAYELLLREALDNFRERWNSHRIRPNKKAGCPCGVPDDLYNLPQLNGIVFDLIRQC